MSQGWLWNSYRCVQDLSIFLPAGEGGKGAQLPTRAVLSIPNHQTPCLGSFPLPKLF